MSRRKEIMHHLHHEILGDLERDRVALEAEAYFEQLRALGIEPALTRRSFRSWLSGIRLASPGGRAVNRPRAV
jgi:hypothetical protein